MRPGARRPAQLLALQAGAELLAVLPPGVGRLGTEAIWRAVGRVPWPAPLPGSAALAARRVALAAHLRRICGPGATGAELDALVGDALASYGRYWAESLRLPHLSREVVLADFVVDGMEHIDAALAAGRGAVLALPHLGGWDWGGSYLATAGYPTSVVMEMLRPPEVFTWFADLRRRLGLEVIAVGPDAARDSVAALAANRLLCLVADRVVPGVTGVPVDFFGAPALLPPGPVALALRTGAPLIPLAVYFRSGSPGHRAVVHPPMRLERAGAFRQDVTAGTQALARELEGLIRAAPTQWHVLQPIWDDDTPAAPG